MRTQLRLRDEKIGIIESEKKLYYCIFFQASDDQINSSLLSYNLSILAKSVSLAMSVANAPVWLLPKSPPRSKDEIFHFNLTK